MKPSELEVGDILLYQATNLMGKIIQFATDGLPHCSIYIGKGRIVEAHPEDGVSEKVLDPKWYSAITVFRWKGGLTEEEQVLLKIRLREKVGLKYDFYAIVSILLWSILRRIGFKQLVMHDPTTLLNPTKKYVCFELASTDYWEIDLDFCKTVNFRQCTGWDIEFSPLIEKMGHIDVG